MVCECSDSTVNLIDFHSIGFSGLPCWLLLSAGFTESTAKPQDLMRREADAINEVGDLVEAPNMDKSWWASPRLPWYAAPVALGSAL